ncbi:MAG: hypothetical protein KGL43_20965, partial [Burkholderiales bacterium]|nr:hypothetical protein [Burkholderiales bacterium]
MPASPASRRTRWIGAACALAVLVIWTAFILVSRSSAHGHLLPFDIAFLRYLVAGLIALPLAALRRGALR